jgi:transcriptional regulator with XRE-family HTH domain
MTEDEALTRRFGELVRRLRSEQGFSQEGFAYRVGLHRTYVGQIERGEKNVTILTANKIAKALGITLASLFTKLERDTTSKEV